MSCISNGKDAGRLMFLPLSHLHFGFSNFHIMHILCTGPSWGVSLVPHTYNFYILSHDIKFKILNQLKFFRTFYFIFIIVYGEGTHVPQHAWIEQRDQLYVVASVPPPLYGFQDQTQVVILPQWEFAHWAISLVHPRLPTFNKITD